ncbi:non-specific lipid transfer protein GPI-anchored 13-like [Curcuma longa]|uniref:non-specific lipid transfer protein GPI-anchored 13-like n=1 Tax=Curcuma longa TaxID=136217 RepID=UPI003D9E6FED
MAPILIKGWSCKWAAVAVVVVVVAVMPPAARSDFASDREECASQLMGLATCIQYVQGEAAAPTPDCCSGFKQVTAKSLKCLCVLVKDRNEPQLGFQINVSLALDLPARCSVPANISDCPRLLNLPPNSTDAQVFLQFEKDLTARAATGGSGASGNNNDDNASASSHLRGDAVTGKSSTGASGSREIKGCLKLAAGVSLAVSILLHLIVFQ